jgi:hypothetical protein
MAMGSSVGLTSLFDNRISGCVYLLWQLGDPSFQNLAISRYIHPQHQFDANMEKSESSQCLAPTPSTLSHPWILASSTLRSLCETSISDMGNLVTEAKMITSSKIGALG